MNQFSSSPKSLRRMQTDKYEDLQNEVVLLRWITLKENIESTTWNHLAFRPELCSIIVEMAE